MQLFDFMPQVRDGAMHLHATFAAFAMLLVYAGILTGAFRAAYGDVGSITRTIASAGVVTLVVFSMPGWVDQLQLLFHSLVEEMGADPAKSHERFAMLIAGPETATADSPGFWDVLFDDQGGIGKAILYAIILLIGKIALAVMWLFFVVQQILLLVAVGVSPVFVAMLLVGAVRDVGVKFLLSLVAIIAWPLGWAVADLFTTGLLQMAAAPETYDPAGGNAALEASQGFFLIVLLSIWMLVSTIAAPMAIYKALQTGGQVGASLLGALSTAVSQGGSYALGAGVTASMSGTSSATAALAAGVAGAGGIISGAAGSTGMILPAAIGTMAVMAGSRSSGDYNQLATEMAEQERKTTSG